MALLTVMKGLPLAYNKDTQEDKEALFDAIDTVEMCLPVFGAMLDTLTVRPKNMAKAAAGGFINATDCALTLRDFRAISGLFDADVYDALALKTCVNGRKVYGGPARESVEKQISLIEEFTAQRR